MTGRSRESIHGGVIAIIVGLTALIGEVSEVQGLGVSPQRTANTLPPRNVEMRAPVSGSSTEKGSATIVKGIDGHVKDKPSLTPETARIVAGLQPRPADVRDTESLRLRRDAEWFRIIRGASWNWNVAGYEFERSGD